MKKVAVYMRVGNKEQLELTEQQQIEAMQRIADNMQGTVTPRTRAIPTPEELKAEGYDVVTLSGEEQDEGEAPTMIMGGG